MRCPRVSRKPTHLVPVNAYPPPPTKALSKAESADTRHSLLVATPRFEMCKLTSICWAVGVVVFLGVALGLAGTALYVIREWQQLAPRVRVRRCVRLCRKDYQQSKATLHDNNPRFYSIDKLNASLSP